MLDTFQMWDPNDWEDYAFGLLQDRHGVLDVHKVPAQHKGDFGIDYLCKKDKVIYQCYSVQEPCTTADRVDKQKVKIHDDLKKFCSDKAVLKNIIGNVQIDHWILLVPFYNSAQINAYISLKTKEALLKPLSYVAPSFQVSVQDLDSFNKLSRSERLLGINKIDVPIPSVTPLEVSSWTSQSSTTLIDNLTRKLSKRVADPNEISSAVNEAITWFLERENALALLRNDAPQLYVKITSAVSRHASRLTLIGHPASGNANSVLSEELKELVNAFEKDIPNFSDESAQKLAFGTLIDWLMRCPLDFPPYSYAT